MVRPGGLACMICPVHPTFPLSRAMADLWMLFPTEEEYIQVRWVPAVPAVAVCVFRGPRRLGIIRVFCLLVCFGGGGGGGRLQVGCVRG